MMPSVPLPNSPAGQSSESQDKNIAVPVWDLAVRLGHWLLVLLVVFCWITGTYGALAWHRGGGYAILALVLFRIYWGFAGSGTARFSSFLRGPRAVWTHARTLLERLGSGPTVGHTPLGGWSIVAMLLLLVVQSGLGLFAVDVDGIESGPLSDRVSFETGRLLAAWHGRVMNTLLILIGLHVAAIVHYWLYKRENLVGAMLSGVKRLPPGTPPPPSFGTFWRAVIGLAAAALAVLAIVTRLHF